jgi:hypothetical protein
MCAKSRRGKQLREMRRWNFYGTEFDEGLRLSSDTPLGDIPFPFSTLVTMMSLLLLHSKGKRNSLTVILFVKRDSKLKGRWSVRLLYNTCGFAQCMEHCVRTGTKKN